MALAQDAAPPQLSLPKRILFAAIMIAIPFLFLELLIRTYLAFEVGPRILLFGTPYSKHQMQFDPGGETRRKAQDENWVRVLDHGSGYTKYFPGQALTDRDEFGKRIHVTINSRGFRGREFATAKQPGVIRIVTLGASSTFGFRDHDDQTYPHYLEQMLNQALASPILQAGDPARPAITAFEVINLGLPHLTSDKIHALFMNEGAQLQPDFVTFYEGINDTIWRPEEETVLGSANQTVSRIPLLTTVYRGLRYRLLSVALLDAMRYKAEFSQRDIMANAERKARRFVANMQAINDACRTSGCKLLVLSQQSTAMHAQREKLRGLTYADEQAIYRQRMAAGGRLTQDEGHFVLHKELMDAQKEWARANAIPFVDVISELDTMRHNLVSWVHLNATGNRVIATALTREIVRQTAGKEVPTAPAP